MQHNLPQKSYRLQQPPRLLNDRGQPHHHYRPHGSKPGLERRHRPQHDLPRAEGDHRLRRRLQGEQAEKTDKSISKPLRHQREQATYGERKKRKFVQGRPEISIIMNLMMAQSCGFAIVHLDC